MDSPAPSAGARLRRLAARVPGLALAGLVLWQGGLGVWQAQRWEFAAWEPSVTWNRATRLRRTLDQGKRVDVFADEVLRLHERILAASAPTTPLISVPLPEPSGRRVYDQLAILVYPRPTAYWEGGPDPGLGRGHVLYLTPSDLTGQPWMEGLHELERGPSFTLWERGTRP